MMFSIMTLSTMAFSIKSINKTTFSIMLMKSTPGQQSQLRTNVARTKVRAPTLPRVGSTNATIYLNLLILSFGCNLH
jgi:hypothetical protein